MALGAGKLSQTLGRTGAKKMLTVDPYSSLSWIDRVASVTFHWATRTL